MDTPLSLLLRSMRYEAPGVLSLELVSPDGGDLPPFEPGAHVDLHLPGGILRQYSLCGDPSDLSHYRVGIRSVPGGQSSQHIHRKLRPGEMIGISLPRNNFPLVDAERYLFVAGGIGITPMIPMMRTASAKGKQWTLLYCNKRNEDAPFLKEILSLGGEVSLHSSEAGTRLNVVQHLADVRKNTVVYCCGPESLMSAVEEATSHWPEDTVRFEWFKPRSRSGDETKDSFEVVCQASGITVEVPPEKSILDALNDVGISIPSSCQQGICGTCEVHVVAGEVDHRDSILSAAERAASETMMICVSRAKGPRLILDV